ncbi:MAG: hypothetical protein RL562_447 [Planctomycetota bacterium]
MNDAFAALQRLKASKVRAVAGIIPVAARVPPASSAPDLPVPLPAAAAVARRKEAAKDVITEARRIASLPRWDYTRMLADCEPGGPLDLTPKLRTPNGTMQLKPVQNLALHWAMEMRGLVAPLAVGAGKTLLSLLVPAVMGAQRPVLLIPPTMQIPLRREMATLAEHFHIPKNLYILPYSQLSVAKSTDILEQQIKPDLVIADEAHMLKNPDSARVRRFLRLFRNFPNTRLVAMSGTFTSKSLKDYAHLAELALREGSPVPIETADLLAWSNVLDSGSQPQDRDWSIFAAFSDLRHINDDTRRKDQAREVFRERFNATPGVVATREASVQCSLNLFERPLQTPTEVSAALDELHRTWTRPDGEEMDSALALWRLGMQMSQGFYMRWVWPNGVVDWEWLEARAGWHREVRFVLQRNIAGMDSPLLVWNAVHRGALTDPTVVTAFNRWEAQKHKPQPPTETVWLDDFLIRNALAWHREHPKGLLWFNDRPTELALRAAGVPTYGAGEVPPLDGSRGGLALSIRSHGTGLNLQHAHHENLLLSFPSSGKTMEQLIGRTHRQGQPEDEVNVWYYRHTADALTAVQQAREAARYIQTTQGSPQKLVYCAWI